VINFSTEPTLQLGAFMLDVAKTMPIHLIPGPTDPSGAILPQQRVPRGMFGKVHEYSTFVCETNPAYLRFATGEEPESETETEVDTETEADMGRTRLKAPLPPPSLSRTFLVNSGQPLDDMYKYVLSPPTTRIQMAENSLKWRHMAPTAPDTLWCHPYFDLEPFILPVTPDFYVVGNQPEFSTELVEEDDEFEGKRRCRVVLVPEFSKTGSLVLVNLRTLEATCMRIGTKGFAVKDKRAQELAEQRRREKEQEVKDQTEPREPPRKLTQMPEALLDDEID
jgi:DNA polymerase delta subunit 2